MEVKDILRNRRIDLGLTLKEVATAVGVSEATVSRWESGDIENMRRDRIAALAAVLDISPGVIMGWEEPVKHDSYYMNPETAQIAQQIYEDKELRALFDAARDISPEDMKTLYSVALAMKRKERGE